jgi:hypothetical protein
MSDRFTYGPTRVFVPINVRHPLGFIGGPGGYEERMIEHVDDLPIIVVVCYRCGCQPCTCRDNHKR